MAARVLRKSALAQTAAPLQLPLAVVPVAPAGTLTELWLGVHLPQPQADPLLLQRLAMLAQRFTPRVSLEPPDGLVLEVKGSLALFGGVSRLYRAFRAGCQAAGASPVLTLAPTPLAALAGGRSGISFKILDQQHLVSAVSPLPLVALRWPPQVLQRLSKLGVYRVGQALRLPRAGFARRFGREPLQMLDQLVARSVDLRSPFRVPERFRAKRQFVREREDHAQILQALQPLLQQLAEFLESRQCGITRITCRLRHRNDVHTDCSVRLAQPEAAAARFQEWFAERLSKLTLPGPVRSLELRSGELMSRAPVHDSLWQPGEHGGGGEAGTLSGSLEFIERLRMRLGELAVHGLICQDSHCPEGASRPLSPQDSAFRRGAATVRAPSQDPLRPLWLLEEPQLLQEREGWPQLDGPLQLRHGPERIESQWWQAPGVARDYYHATDVHGIAVWVFRERQPPHRWFLHGLCG
ncbi:MAG TPA: DNA polymerase Y family protein [Steroidobacteraceae bacterium]|nr:DNA polymerase Y family protein [Steroidobacteraceae bacterium]